MNLNGVLKEDILRFVEVDGKAKCQCETPNSRICGTRVENKNYNMKRHLVSYHKWSCLTLDHAPEEVLHDVQYQRRLLLCKFRSC